MVEGCMTESNTSAAKMADPGELARAMASVAERSQRIVSDFLARQAEDVTAGRLDPLNIGEAFLEMTASLMTDPAHLVEAQINLWRDYMNLWQNSEGKLHLNTQILQIWILLPKMELMGFFFLFLMGFLPRLMLLTCLC